MQEETALTFRVMAKPSPNEEKPRAFPQSYVTYLLDQARELKLNEGALAAAIGKNPIGITRLKNGEGTGVPMATAIREYLIDRGLDIPPIPVGATVWKPPTAATTRAPTPSDTEDEIVRLNMIRFREAVHLDQLAAATRSGVSYNDLLAYERGERVPSTAVLRLLAPHYGRRAGHFIDTEDVGPPDPTVVPLAGAWIDERIKEHPAAEKLRDLEQQLREAERELRVLLDDPKFIADKKAQNEHIRKARRKEK